LPPGIEPLPPPAHKQLQFVKEQNKDFKCALIIQFNNCVAATQKGEDRATLDYVPKP